MRTERRWLGLAASIAVLALLIVGIVAGYVLRNQFLETQQSARTASARALLTESLEEIRQILEQESRRPFTEYSHSNFRGVSAQSFIRFSNISALAPSVRLPGLVGFFQISEKQKLELPFFPEGLSAENTDRQRRKDLARKVYSAIYKTGPLNSGKDAASAAKETFEKLFQGIWLPNFDTSDITPLKPVLTKTLSTKSLKKAFPIETLEDLSTESKNLTSNSKAFPLQAFLLESGYIVFYRTVLHENRPLTQGFVVNQKIFFQTIFARLLEHFQKVDKGSRLTLLIGDQALEFMQSPVDDGLTLFRIDNLEPFSGLSLLISSDHARLSASHIWALLLIAIVLIAIIGVIGLMYITAIRQLELSTRQSAFISAVSHELRTPLTAIRMHGEILKSGWTKDETEKTKSYDYILKESERLSRLIENVLRYARIGQDSDPLKLEPHKVSDIIKLIEERISVLATQSGFQFELIDKSGDTNTTVEIDRDALTQILINLVDNGIKFSRTSPQKQIVATIESDLTQSLLLIRIRDFGPGISARNRAKIFDLFFRAEDEMTRSTPGTGLGLALVKSLADRMNIAVHFENRQPGCEFVLSFKIA